MRQFVRWMRHLLYPAAALLLLWAGYQVFRNAFISDSSGRILVVYNADNDIPNLVDCSRLAVDDENLAEQALIGVCNAYHDPKGSHPAIDLLNIHESLDSAGKVDAGKLYGLLSAKLAHGAFLGAISLLTSPDSLPVVRFFRTMQVPLLLTIAANDELLSPAEDTTGVVFRMMPTNSEQARDIAKWIQDKGYRRIALFHEPNSFGEYLFRQVDKDLQMDQSDPSGKAGPVDRKLFKYEVREHMEFADIMPELWCDDLDALVYLGFAPRAVELMNKLRSPGQDLTHTNCPVQHSLPHPKRDQEKPFQHLSVLLSSGAYDKDLSDGGKYAFQFQVAAMLSNHPASGLLTESPNETLISQYGYDAYKLMTRVSAMDGGRSSDALQATLSSGPDDSRTGHLYRFDKFGELQKDVKDGRNQYRVYSLVSSAKTPESMHPHDGRRQ